MQHEFQRVAIVNRGEAAMRFIHAAREFNQEYGTSLCTIALYTEPDRHAMFVCEADEAVSLGAAMLKDPATGQSKSSYVDYDVLERALTSARAEAVWVGWGFVAEHPGLRRPLPQARVSCSSARMAMSCDGWATRSAQNFWPSRRRSR